MIRGQSFFCPKYLPKVVVIGVSHPVGDFLHGAILIGQQQRTGLGNAHLPDVFPRRGTKGAVKLLAQIVLGQPHMLGNLVQIQTLLGVVLVDVGPGLIHLGPLLLGSCQGALHEVHPKLIGQAGIFVLGAHALFHTVAVQLLHLPGQRGIQPHPHHRAGVAVQTAQQGQTLLAELKEEKLPIAGMLGQKIPVVSGDIHQKGLPRADGILHLIHHHGPLPLHAKLDEAVFVPPLPVVPAIAVAVHPLQPHSTQGEQRQVGGKAKAYGFVLQWIHGHPLLYDGVSPLWHREPCYVNILPS